MTGAGDVPKVRPGIFATSAALEEQLLCALRENPHVNGAMVIPISMNLSSKRHAFSCQLYAVMCEC